MFNSLFVRKSMMWLGISLALLSNVSAIADAAPRIKLLEAGWEQPTAVDLRQNLKQMENTPFDGFMLMLRGRDDAGRSILMTNAFSDVPWKLSWFQSSIDDLKAAQSSRLTDNFIRLNSNPANVDWFDDAGWKEIINHWRIAAEVVKQTGLKGIMLDTEHYTPGASQYDYAAQPQRDQHTFEQYQEKARQRGRELISAVAQVDPKITLFTFFMLTEATNIKAAQSTDPQAVLKLAATTNLPPANDPQAIIHRTGGYNLGSAFVNGWLDVAPSTMKFVEGCEPGYGYVDEIDYLRAANIIRHKCLRLIAPENRDKYKTQMHMAMAFYLDAYANPSTSPWYIPPVNGLRIERLKENLQYAGEVVDQYIWFWGEKHRWFSTPNKPLANNSWEDAIPGVNQTLLAFAHPERLVEMAEAQLDKAATKINLIQNGDFSAEGANTASANKVMDWQSKNAPQNWNSWQTAKSTGTIGLDKTVNHDGKSYSAKFVNVLEGSLIQQHAVQPGEMYLVRAWSRQQGAGSSLIRVDWQTAEKGWLDGQKQGVTFMPEKSTSADGWQQIQGVVTVPEGAAKLVVIVSTSNQPTDGAIWFDDVQLYKIPKMDFSQ